jgi:hypothetical protein
VSARKDADEQAAASLRRLRAELADRPAETDEEWYAPTVRALVRQGRSADEILDYLERTTARRSGFLGSNARTIEGLLAWERTAVRALADELRQSAAPAAEGEPRWRHCEEWSRADFERAVAWDKAHKGRGGKISIGRRCAVSPAKLYRRWQAVAPGEPWPSGNKGPLNRRT